MLNIELLSDSGSTASKLIETSVSQASMENSLTRNKASTLIIQNRLNFISFIVSAMVGDLTLRLDPEKTKDAFNVWNETFGI